MKLFFTSFSLVLLVFGCASERVESEGANPETIVLDRLNSAPLLLNDHFAEVVFLPVFGGELYDVTSATDFKLDEEFTLHVGGVDREIIRYEKGVFVDAFAGTKEGINKVIGVDQFIVDGEKAYTILDRTGQVIIKVVDNQVTERTQLGLYAWDFARHPKGYMLYVGNNPGINQGRLCLVDEEGNLLKDYFPIGEKRYINIRKHDFIYDEGGVLYFAEPHYQTIYDLTLDGPQSKIKIDFGDRQIPESFYDRGFTNVAEFLMPLGKTDYFRNEADFYELNDFYTFTFMAGMEEFQAFVGKSDQAKAFTPSELIFGVDSSRFSLDGLVINAPRGKTGENGYLFWTTPQESFTSEEKIDILDQPILDLSEAEKEAFLANWEEEYRFGILMVR